MDSYTIEKELSWLSFNERVLQEAADSSVPIIERIRFLGIYSANLNEFFRVRVANIRRKSLVVQLKESKTNPSEELLLKILKKINQLTDKFTLVFEQAFEELSKHHIYMIFNEPHNNTFQKKLSKYQLQWLEKYFDHHIVHHITPIVIDSKTQLSACLEENCIYFLTALNQEKGKTYVLVEIPRQVLPRFIILPTQGSKKNKYIVLIDDIIEYFISKIFNAFFSYLSIDAYSIELIRDAEYNLTDELDRSLLDKMSKGLKQRLTSEPVRISYDKNMPDYMKKFLNRSLKTSHSATLVLGTKYRHFKDFIDFPNLGRKNLEKTKIKALESSNFRTHSSVFSAITARDILLYYPYYKFSHFTEFIRQASYDPNVEEIMINIYRVDKNSRIINSLMDAVKNGKEVTVVVELKARFDEQINIDWATKMKDAGVHVEFGIETLKIHAKLCLVTRNENGQKTRYAHIGTGNFHEKNARIYTDFALFTCHKDICQEVENVFSFIAYSYKRYRFNHLLVSPLTLRRRLYQLIDNEIKFADAGIRAEIVLKVNNLVDTGLITRLYAASNAGVKVKLIVRGMCSLLPGIKGLSENIKAISIVDQFLEHSRVMVFRNNNKKLVFISSADWMTRNLDHRVEVACPIYDELLKKRIIHILDLHFKDTTKARVINQSQNNRYVARGNRKKIRSQMAIYDYIVIEEQTNN